MSKDSISDDEVYEFLSRQRQAAYDHGPLAQYAFAQYERAIKEKMDKAKQLKNKQEQFKKSYLGLSATLSITESEQN